VPWLLLVAFSLTLHLWDLGERSYHHDEAIHAHAAHVILKDGTYQYNPTYHGPLLYFLTAATFVVGGQSDFTARLPIALSGVALIAVAWSLRRPFGPRAAWWMGLIASISPIYLYYGRFLRMDVLEALVASAAFVALWRANRGSSRAWVWFGVWVGLAFATKENAFVTAAISGGVLGLVLIHRGLRHMVPTVLRWVVEHRWHLLAAVAAAVVVTVPLFTVGFRHPGDWFFPHKAISYWWGQHSMERVAGPPWYHLPRLALYEFLPIIAGLTWAVRRGRKMRTLEWSLLLFGLASVGMYCYLGEKVPWLGVHQVWAFIPLAGLQLARTFGRLSPTSCSMRYRPTSSASRPSSTFRPHPRSKSRSKRPTSSQLRESTPWPRSVARPDGRSRGTGATYRCGGRILRPASVRRSSSAAPTCCQLSAASLVMAMRARACPCARGGSWRPPNRASAISSAMSSPGVRGASSAPPTPSAGPGGSCG
jgi:uncharacterized protein (TIGR03663 family)